MSPEDAADDPAIWVDGEDPSRGLVLGTDKKRGLHVYDLDGEERQVLPVGLLNNVDMRQGVRAGQRRIDIAVASNRSDQTLSLFEVNGGDIPVRFLPEASIATGFTEVYGVCMYHSRITGHAYAFANDKDGRYAQWRLFPGSDGAIESERVREFSVDSQPEGCVADDATGQLYIGEEERGIWRVTAEPDVRYEPELLDTTDGGVLVADVEGLAIYRDGERTLLIASSQGNNSYAVYDATGEVEYLGSFRVSAAPNGGPDGASETDGIEATATLRNAAFPAGILVVQDGHNRPGGANQNFKYVSMADVLSALATASAD